MVDPVLGQKLDSLRKCIERIESKCPVSVDVLKTDLDIQDIISVNLERAVQQCVDAALVILAKRRTPVPGTMQEAFEELESLEIITTATCSRMRSAVGFRNTIVHAYRKVDWDIVWDIITNRLDNFRIFTAELLEKA